MLRTTRLLGIGPGVMCAGLLCGFAVAADPPAARADPALKDTTCTVTSISFNKGPVEWRVKGVTSVTGLPAAAKGATVTVTLTFEKKAAGTDAWAKVTEIKQYVAAREGTIVIDTGDKTFTPAPAAGDQYRVKVSGDYRFGGDHPAPPKAITADLSPAVTPVR